MKKLLAIVLAMSLFLTPLVGCSKNSGPAAAKKTDDKVIKIGVILPFSGHSSYFGKSQLVGYQHAIKDYFEKYAPDMKGMTVQLVQGDSASVADTGVTEFERMVNQEKVSAVIGTYNSGTAAAMAPLAIKYKVPFMVTNAVSDVILSENSNYVFRANLGDADGVSTYIKFINFLSEKQGKKIKKVAILYEGTDYGQGAYKNFTTKILPKVDAEVVFGQSFTNNSADLSSVINKIKASKADLVIPIMFLNDALLFSRQMKEFEVNIPILAYGGGFLGDDYLKQSGKTSEYAMVSGSWIYDKGALSEDAAAWAKKYIEETGNTVPNEPYANGWLGMYCLLEAIARAGSGDREAIAKALDATDIKPGDRALLFHTTFPGVKFEDFDGRYNQNIHCGMQYAQAIDGRYQIVFPADPVTGKTPLVFPVPKWADR